MKFRGVIRARRLESSALLLLSVIVSPAFAQQSTVSLSSGNSVPGGTVSLSISLASTVGVQSAAVQWTMGYSASSVTSVSVIAGSSLTAASKIVTCSPNTTGSICVAYGMNSNAISDGIIATATFQIAPGVQGTSVPVQITGVSASTPPGILITGAGAGGTISITQPVLPTLSSLSCAPTTVTAPGSSVCTLTLTSPALAGGFSAALSSQNSAVSVPSTANVPAGTSSATFTATLGAVSTNQTAILTAAAGGVTKTFNLSIVSSQWSISGGASALGSGATVTLSGAKSAIVTADASGNFTFIGLANGAYAVTPAKTGYTFSPATKAVTVSSGNVTGVTFTATAQQTTWTVSGTVSPSTLGAGTILTLSSGATTTADSSGNFTFNGIANGTYIITPSKTGFSSSPTNKSVTVNGANIIGIAFTATQNQTTSSIAPDVGVWRDQSMASATITSPTFSTESGNELLLAFIAANAISGSNTTVRSVSGAGLTWVLALRTNAQSGTAEIWRAFATGTQTNVSVTASFSENVAGSMTVMSFSGVDTTGTNGSGALGATAMSASWGPPTAMLTTTRKNSWVFGVGNDRDQAISRTPGAGQTVIHQYLLSTLGTFWVQSQGASTSSAGSNVLISDTSPNSDYYNLSAIEILPSLSVSGKALQTQIEGSVISTALPVGLGNSADGSASSAAVRAMTMSNTASGLPGDSCSPGGLATLLGSGFTTQTPQPAKSIPLPMTISGVQVTVNGHLVPLIMVSSAQVNFLCPLLPPGSPLTITLQAENSTEYSIQSVMKAASPGLFSMGTTRQGLITISATNEIAMPKQNGVQGRPAHHGEVLSIFATGLGPTSDSIPRGTAAPQDRLVGLGNPIKVVVGGLEFDPLFSGLAPATVGLYQVNAKLPPEVPIGATVPMTLQVILADGTVVESNEVTVAISD